MGVSSAMDWWDEWKLRILVLCSLFIQFFLYFSGFMRRLYILRRLRVTVWIAYMGSDALAIYALAILFNRQQQQTAADGGGGVNALEVIWAPVLLIHLGGRQSITAFSLEDNELWKRHAITLVSQITVALYVFCKWWSGEKRLFQAAILLFIFGILRFCEKPWALRRASFGTLMAYTDSSQQNHESTMKNEEYVKEAHELIKKKAQVDPKFEVPEKHINMMFLDQYSPYHVRLGYLKSFLNEYGDEKRQHEALMTWINWQFFTMYSKVRSSTTRVGCCSINLLPCLALASVALFAQSGKDGYNKSDITITYILLSGTAVMEFMHCILGLFLCSCLFRRLVRSSNFASSFPWLMGSFYEDRSWQDMVSQHNILLFCARKKPTSTLMKKLLSAFGPLRDYINKHRYTWHEKAAQRVSVLVRLHAEDGWKKHIDDRATYRIFNNYRGELALYKYDKQQPPPLLEQLRWSFNLPFDERVLLWHVATDLCLHHTEASPSPSSSSQGGDDAIASRRNSEIISNYMIYLLFICPDMLMLGARENLFMDACNEIDELVVKQDELPLSSMDNARRILDMEQQARHEDLREKLVVKQDEPPPSSTDIARRIIDMEQKAHQDLRKKAPTISNALRLKKALTDHIDGDKERWEVIQGVWVEMLCYSASRSRGYEHAKSLAYGGEFLTNVWLLWSFMGMETLPDKLHNPGPPEPFHHVVKEQTPVAALV